MKKILFTILHIFIGFFLFSEGFYLSPNISLKNGTAKEYVFDGSHKLSQLDWNVQNQVNVGLKTELLFERLYFGFDFSVGLYNFSGFMEDRDWLDENAQDFVSRYSYHDLTVSKDFDFSFDIGMIFESSRKKSEKLFLKIDFSDSMFFGNNGWYDYKDINSTDSLDGYGTVISYNPSIYSFLLNYDGKFLIENNFYVNLEIGLGLSSFGNCTDNHILTKTEFVDKVKGCLLFRENISFSYEFSDNHALVFGGKLENLPLLKGPTYVNGFSSNGIGGFSSFFYEFYLSYRIRIL